MHQFAATNGHQGYAGSLRSPARNAIPAHSYPLMMKYIRNHLKGNDPHDRAGRDFTIGVYPLLIDETVGFLQLTLINQLGLKTLSIS